MLPGTATPLASDFAIEAAMRSPVYKMAVEWKVAFPLHPEYRTLPMVWYVPPLSPIQSAAEAGKVEFDGILPKIESLRIPVKYLANLLTAGDEKPIVRALKRIMAMRLYKRAETVEGKEDLRALEEAGPVQRARERAAAVRRARKLERKRAERDGAR